MAKQNLIETTNGGKLRATPQLVAAIEAEFNSGKKLPEAIKSIDAVAKARTIHLVSPVYWRLEAAKLGSLDATRAAVVAARKSGQRREVVAARAGITVAQVAKFEGKKPVYTGRGTKKHTAPAA